MDSLAGGTTLSKLIYLPSEKRPALEGKNLLPFIFERVLFQKGLGVQENKQEVTKVDSLETMVKNLPSSSNPTDGF